MDVGSWLKQAEARMAEAGITTARLDALVLLEDATSRDRTWLLAHSEHKLERSELQILNKKCIQRADHIPLAYVRGKTEFYGREFVITPAVLEPRPESEAMIELLKALPLPSEPVLADVGTGSGALAITGALEIATAKVYANDIDEKCLQVARQNAQKYALGEDRVNLGKSDLLEGLQGVHLDALLCNLPYVPDSYQINTAAMHEPHLAIFGGADGLDYYRTLFKQIDGRSDKPAFILTESLPPQHHYLAQIARTHRYVLEKSDDFIQLFVKM